MSIITKVDVIPFTFKVHDLGLGSHRTMGVSNLSYQKGGTLEVMRYAIRIITNDGVEGHYVTHWVGTQGALGQTLMLAPHLLGRNAEHREVIYDDFKRELRAYDHMGHGPLDIALWVLTYVATHHQQHRHIAIPRYVLSSRPLAGLAEQHEWWNLLQTQP